MEETVEADEPVKENGDEDSSTTKISIDELSTYYGKSDEELLDKLRSDLNVDVLVFTGRFESKPVKNSINTVGIFTDVKHINGLRLYYPIVNSPIDNLYVSASGLKERGIYKFSVVFNKLDERKKRNNPFLLRADSITKAKTIELFVLEDNIKQKKTEQHIIEKNITRLHNEQESISIQNKNQMQFIANEAQEQLNEINKSIEETQLLRTLNEQALIEEQSRFNALIEQSKQMESTIELLQHKLSLCQDLGFLTNEEADKYLSSINSKPYQAPEIYLDFEEDLNGVYANLVQKVHEFLHFKKGLIYTRFQIRNFLSLLLTHDIIVLSGLSGSGKTQIVKAFAEALGGVAKIIPVKPNWTSSDDLIGYYNPLQGSFMPTPFTEAIVEAVQNPHKLYLICLDEMNLARVEYYFADFLSKLEEREHQPEIELYAQHEEDMFVAEFKTVMALMESAIGSDSVNSWVDFLTNDTIRTRFFELLGASEKDTVLHIHANMKKRLMNILKFPATLRIPGNVRFIGAINVDETTHYFSPKILDRVHIVKFENPLLYEELVNKNMEPYDHEDNQPYRPVYVSPRAIITRTAYPYLKASWQLTTLRHINEEYLLNINIDFGMRSMRQSNNYIGLYILCKSKESHESVMELGDISSSDSNLLNHSIGILINQKILPRFVFDGNETAKNGLRKIEILEKMTESLEKGLKLNNSEEDNYEHGIPAQVQLQNMIEIAKLNNGQVNFFA